MKTFILFLLVVGLQAQTVINGSRDWQKITAPGNPASIRLRVYADTAKATIDLQLAREVAVVAEPKGNSTLPSSGCA